MCGWIIDKEIDVLILCFESCELGLNGTVAKLSDGLDNRCKLELPFIFALLEDRLVKQAADLRRSFNHFEVK